MTNIIIMCVSTKDIRRGNDSKKHQRSKRSKKGKK